jgi:hypothetical protein
MSPIRSIGALLITIGSLLAASPDCRADELFADFTTSYVTRLPTPVSGQVRFSLNPDGTVDAHLASFAGGIYGFGFDSAMINVPQSNFSTPPIDTAGWTDGDQFASGFLLCFRECPYAVSWTIGVPGQFSSVWETITGTGSAFDFIFLAVPGSGSQIWLASPVPEPPSGLLLALGGLAMLLRVRGWHSARSRVHERR